MKIRKLNDIIYMSLSTYYEINRKNLDRYLLDFTNEYISDEKKLNKLTLEKTEKIINYAKKNYNQIQKDTLDYILENCNFTIVAKKWMEKKIKTIEDANYQDVSFPQKSFFLEKEENDSLKDTVVFGKLIEKKFKKEDKNHFIFEPTNKISFKNINKLYNLIPKYFFKILLLGSSLFFLYFYFTYKQANPIQSNSIPQSVQTSLSHLTFKQNHYILDESSIQTLTKIKEILYKYPNSKLEIIGYTSVQGKVEKNIKITQLRVIFTKKFFIENKIERRRLETKIHIAPVSEIKSLNRSNNYYRRVIFRLKPLEKILSSN